MRKEISGKELIDRYRKNYGIVDNAHITEGMILRHWELEKKLTRKLLASTSDTRWETFEYCYRILYGDLEWLNRLIDSGRNPKLLERYHYSWLKLIGSTSKKIYEIGPGKGELIKYLAARNYTCKGSEITRERGKKWADDMPDVSWGISDGVHLERFEPKNYYDVVISDQVIEHLHPDDLVEHFSGVYQILTNGGRYIFRTPHVHKGPSDISSVFECEKPKGMHLKEYSYSELILKLRRAGFKSVFSPLPLRNKLDALLSNYSMNRFFRIAYLMYLVVIESFINVFPNQRQRRKAIRIASKLFFSPTITLLAKKQIT